MKSREELNSLENSEKKIAELSDDELKAVSGGYGEYQVTETRYDFSAGDTFQANGLNNFFVIMDDVNGARGDDMLYCKFYFYIGVMEKFEFRDYQSKYVHYLVQDCTYRGNGIINDDNTYVNRGPRIAL